MLGVIDQLDYEQTTLNLHILPYVKDYCVMDEKYYIWSYLFDSLVLKHFGIQDLQPKTPAYYETMQLKFYYAIINDEGLKAMLHGVSMTRSENYGPKNLSGSPILSGR